jgi:uncharacterized protein (TIGR04255 family)
MGEPLKNAPVYLTVAQVRFNPILALGDFVTEVQEGFRREGFPDFKQNTVHGIQITVSNGEAAVPVPHAKPQYLFGNIGNTQNFLVDTDSLTFQSTDYGRFEAFSRVFLHGLELLHGIVKLDYTERVGARYLDRVQPQQGETLSDYLQAQALGLGVLLQGKVAHSFCQSLVDSAGARLVSRVLISSGPIGFPPDLLPMNLRVLERFQQQQGLHAILDNDGFFQGREPYSVEAVRKHLSDIHNVILGAFKVLTTPYALKMWDQ